MPIVKQKPLSDFRNEPVPISLQRKSFGAVKQRSVSEEGSMKEVNPEHTIEQKAYDVITETQPFDERNTSKLTFHEPVKSVENIVHPKSKLSTLVSKIEHEIRETFLTRDARCKENDSKLFHIGLSTGPNVGSTETKEKVELLLQLMNKTRACLSESRRKLLQEIRASQSIKMHNRALDDQKGNIAMDEYNELKAEVNRISEKLDETRKRVNSSEKRFESNVARATHVREKLFNFQNRILSTMENFSDVQRSYEISKQNLYELLQRKKKLRKENESLKRRFRDALVLSSIAQKLA